MTSKLAERDEVKQKNADENVHRKMISKAYSHMCKMKIENKREIKMKKLNNEKKIGIKQASVRSLSLCFILLFKSISRIETTNFHDSLVVAV